MKSVGSRKRKPASRPRRASKKATSSATSSSGRAAVAISQRRRPWVQGLVRRSKPDARVTIRDLAGDGDHYAAEVVAESFRGKSRVQQHQMVYEALKGNMGGVLHALALQTSIPE